MQLARPHQRLRRAANLGLAERERRGRQQTDLDPPADAYWQPGEFGRLGLEGGPILGPVDEMRPDQRCYQRQDDRNRNSEQGRLQKRAPSPSAQTFPGTS